MGAANGACGPACGGQFGGTGCVAADGVEAGGDRRGCHPFAGDADELPRQFWMSRQGADTQRRGHFLVGHGGAAGVFDQEHAVQTAGHGVAAGRVAAVHAITAGGELAIQGVATAAALVQIQMSGQGVRCICRARDGQQLVVHRFTQAVNGKTQVQAGHHLSRCNGRLGDQTHASVLNRVGGAITVHEESGLFAFLHVVVGGFGSGEFEGHQTGGFFVVVQVVQMVFLPDATVYKLHQVLGALHGHSVTTTRADIEPGRFVVECVGGLHGVAVQVVNAQGFGFALGEREAARGVDAHRAVVVGAVTSTAASHQQCGGGQCGQQKTSGFHGGHGLISFKGQKWFKKWRIRTRPRPCPL